MAFIGRNLNSYTLYPFLDYFAINWFVYLRNVKPVNKILQTQILTLYNIKKPRFNI